MSGSTAEVDRGASDASPEQPGPARFWRVAMVDSTAGADIWDVEAAQFLAHDAEMVAWFASGDAGPGYGAEQAFTDGPGWWGGRPGADGSQSCSLGVEFDVAVVPTAITLSQRSGPHRATRIAVESSDDAAEWIVQSVADLRPDRLAHTPFYAPADVETASGWRLVTRSTAHSFAWDVHRLRLLRRGVEVTGTVTASGAAGSGFEIHQALVDGGSFWGGRHDDDGRFDITIAGDSDVELDRIVLDQGEDHWARSVLLERRTEDGGWRAWRHFGHLHPGRNDLFLYHDPAPLTPEPETDRPRTPRFGTFDDRRILVLIAAYRDPDLPNTIRSALAQSAYPEHLRFAICHQADDESQALLAPWGDDPRFAIDQVDHRESRGCCWARNRTFALYDDEPYVLQVDAHMRFAARWDVRLIEMLESIDADLPILTTYPPNFVIGADGAVEYDLAAGVQALYIETVRDDLTTLQKTSPPADLTSPGPSPTLAAGQLFTRGSFCRDVPYDPDMYFAGEEISLAARAFTSGYDLFSPNENLVWHLYDHLHPKHWDDHLDHSESHAGALARLRTLLRGDASTLGAYGLGTSRTLAEFEDHANVDLGARRVAADGSASIDIDRSVIEPRDDYVAFVVVFLDGDGNEVDRRSVVAPDVLDLSRSMVTVSDLSPAASRFVVVPVARTGWLGELVVRRLVTDRGSLDR